MRSKRSFVGMMVAVLALVLGSGSLLIASNMGFKLNRLLNKPTAGVSKTGQHYLALPYFRQTGLNKVGDLWLDAGGSTYLQRISRLIESSDQLQTYSGLSAVGNFAVEPGVFYVVQIKATAPSGVNYIASHY